MSLNAVSMIETQLNGRASMHIIFGKHIENSGANNHDSRTSCLEPVEAMVSNALKCGHRVGFYGLMWRFYPYNV